MEMIKPFFIGLLGFIVFMISEMMFILIDQVVSRGVDLISVIKIIVYRVPAFSVIAIPVAVLFAVVNAVTKLESNFEITSMRILGLRFFYIVVPFLWVAIFLTFLNFFLNERVVPVTMKVSEDIVKEKIIRSSVTFIQPDVFFKMPDGRIVIVRSVDKIKKQLNNIVIIDVRSGNFGRTISASRGYIDNLSIILENGYMIDFGRDGFIKTQIKFEKLIIPFNLSIDDIVKELRNPWEMSLGEIKKEVDERGKYGWRDNFLMTQLYLKFSLPISCVVVVFLSLPLAVMFSNRGRFVGLLISVFLIFVYYGLFSFFVALGKNNLLNPFLAAFGANFVMLFTGIILVYLVEK